MYYTLGQRQGLEVGGVRGAAERPWYVARKDLERNVLIVVQQPDHPLLMRWTSSNWDYEIAVYDDKGQGAYLQQEAIDANNRIGILKVNEPRTFVIVMTGRSKSTYSIELNDIPGMTPVKKPG